MNTKNNVSIEKAKNNKTAAIALVTVALALSMVSAASIMAIQGPQQANAQSNSGGHSQTCTQEATAPSSSGGVDVTCVQEAGQCQVAQNSGRDSAGEISGDTQDCS
jgi:hypothetical protein